MVLKNEEQDNRDHAIILYFTHRYDIWSDSPKNL